MYAGHGGVRPGTARARDLQEHRRRRRRGNSCSAPRRTQPSTTSTGWRSRPNGAMLLAATDSGIYRSIDGGAPSRSSGHLRHPGLRQADVTSISIPATARGRSPSGYRRHSAWYSTDGGLDVDWPRRAAVSRRLGRVELAYAPSNPAIVYASVESTGGTIYKSTNGGGATRSYRRASILSRAPGLVRQHPLGRPDEPEHADRRRRRSVAEHQRRRDADRNSAGNRSRRPPRDRVDAWVQRHARTASVLRQRRRRIYSVNDYSAALGHRLDRRTTTSGSPSSTAPRATSSGTIIGGTQDNGTLRYTTAGGTTGLDVDGSAATAATPRPTRPTRTTSTASTNGSRSTAARTAARPRPSSSASRFRITAATATSSRRSSSIRTTRTRCSPAADRSGAPPTRSSAIRRAWLRSRPPIGSNISAIAVAPGNSDICWVGHNNGDVYKTTDGTAASPSVDAGGHQRPGLPNRMVTRLTIDPATVRNRVYVTFGGFSTDNVWGRRTAAHHGAVAAAPASPRYPPRRYTTSRSTRASRPAVHGHGDRPVHQSTTRARRGKCRRTVRRTSSCLTCSGWARTSSPPRSAVVYSKRARSHRSVRGFQRTERQIGSWHSGWDGRPVAAQRAMSIAMTR